jgi:hypothetical protein
MVISDIDKISEQAQFGIVNGSIKTWLSEHFFLCLPCATSTPSSVAHRSSPMVSFGPFKVDAMFFRPNAFKDPAPLAYKTSRPDHAPTLSGPPLPNATSISKNFYDF